MKSLSHLTGYMQTSVCQYTEIKQKQNSIASSLGLGNFCSFLKNLKYLSHNVVVQERAPICILHISKSSFPFSTFQCKVISCNLFPHTNEWSCSHPAEHIPPLWNECLSMKTYVFSPYRVCFMTHRVILGMGLPTNNCLPLLVTSDCWVYFSFFVESLTTTKKKSPLIFLRFITILLSYHFQIPHKNLNNLESKWIICRKSKPESRSFLWKGPYTKYFWLYCPYR